MKANHFLPKIQLKLVSIFFCTFCSEKCWFHTSFLHYLHLQRARFDSASNFPGKNDAFWRTNNRLIETADVFIILYAKILKSSLGRNYLFSFFSLFWNFLELFINKGFWQWIPNKCFLIFYSGWNMADNWNK